jgi:septum formation protein
MICKPLVLASSSAYRRALLDRLGLPYIAVSPDIDENPLPGEAAAALAARLAQNKAEALAERYPGHLLIGSDQAAALDGAIIGKPGTLARAKAQLRAAAGRSVDFHTAVCVMDSVSRERLTTTVPTTVEFRALSSADIAAYLAREAALDCAGSFKAEALGIALCRRISGDDPSALIGLPLIELTRLLAHFGVDVLTRSPSPA